MSASPLPRMTADEFIAWAMERPETEHYELLDGKVIAVTPQTVGHVRAKMRVARLLAKAVEHSGLRCEVFGGGVAVQAGDATVFEPDGLVQCGPPLDGEAVKVTDPLVVIEVLAPSSRSLGSQLKLIDYARIPSLRHYLIVLTDIRAVVHHQFDTAGNILNRIIRDGPIVLDPPGIELSDVFG